MPASGRCQQVALVIAPPLDFVSFCARVPNSDWLAKYHRVHGSDSEKLAHLAEVWQSEYLPLVAEPLSRLSAMGRERGATVFVDATLSNFVEATANFPVVILVAHWKGPELANDDLISQDISKFAERARACKSTIGDWLAARLAEQGDTVKPSGFVEKLRIRISRTLFTSSSFAPSLRDLLEQALLVELVADPSKKDGVSRSMKHNVTKASEGRDAIDEIFSGLIRPGNRLELADGLYSKEMVEHAVASGFGGILDLTTCTSSVLADHLSRVRRQKFRTVQFPAEQDFMWCAFCIKATLSIYDESSMSYLEARAIAMSLMTTAVRQRCSDER